MIAIEQQVPHGKGILQIFAFFLLAMVGGFVGGELSKANMLTSSVPPPPHKDPGCPREQPA